MFMYYYTTIFKNSDINPRTNLQDLLSQLKIFSHQHKIITNCFNYIVNLPYNLEKNKTILKSIGCCHNTKFT